VYLIHVLLPLYDNGHNPLPQTEFRQVAAELTEKFGGLTAHTRAPAQGLWRADDEAAPKHDDIVIYEVIVDSLDRLWWADYRTRLERRFRQDHVLIRAQSITVL
jgi:hypothetical protein